MSRDRPVRRAGPALALAATAVASLILFPPAALASDIALRTALDASSATIGADATRDLARRTPSPSATDDGERAALSGGRAPRARAGRPPPRLDGARGAGQGSRASRACELRPGRELVGGERSSAAARRTRRRSEPRPGRSRRRAERQPPLRRGREAPSVGRRQSRVAAVLSVGRDLLCVSPPGS